MSAKQPPPPNSPTPPIRLLDHYWSDERSRRRFVDDLFDRTSGDYDRVERLLAFGTGSRYRRDALRRAGLRPGMRVLDIATGTGLVAREALALAGPAGMVVGLDPSAGMLEQASHLESPLLIRAFGERLPCRDASFDFVSMGFGLRHVADLGLLFGEIRRVLRPGGTACILELTRPRSRASAAVLRTFMTKLVPAIAGNAARRAEARQLMAFYWDTIDACVSPEAVLLAMKGAGFASPARGVVLGMFSEYLATNGSPEPATRREPVPG
jgi:demethylmenaquinone methyltransferase/2-methoxy-6-polyprenyl-1,4-benzoquinol methylase